MTGGRCSFYATANVPLLLATLPLGANVSIAAAAEAASKVG